MTMRFKSFGEMRRFAAAKRISQQQRVARAINHLNFTGELLDPPHECSHARWAAMIARVIMDEGEFLC